MIHFFRNIRKRLLNDRKISKYFAYALGEIILVMIGILLALQVNNWNETRKRNALIDSRARVLFKDLSHNIQEANAIIDFADRYDSIFDRVISNEDQSSSFNSISTLLSSQTAQFYKESLLFFLEDGEQLPNTYLPLLPELKGLNRLFLSQEKWEAISLEDREDITRNVMFTNEYKLTSSSEETVREELKRLQKSDGFRNRVLLSYGSTLLDENAWDVTQIRAACLILLWKLQKVVDTKELPGIQEYLEMNGLVPFHELSCSNVMEGSNYREKFRSYRMAFLFYNATEEDRKIEFLDADLQSYKSITLAPKSFHFNQYELYDEDKFEVRTGGTCLGRYKAVRNGFLLIKD